MILLFNITQEVLTRDATIDRPNQFYRLHKSLTTKIDDLKVPVLPNKC